VIEAHREPKSETARELQPALAVLEAVADRVHSQDLQAKVTLDSIGEAIFALDLQGRIALANPTALRWAAVDARPLLGRSIHDIAPGLLGTPDDPLRILHAAADHYGLKPAGGSPGGGSQMPWLQEGSEDAWNLGDWAPPWPHRPTGTGVLESTLTAIRSRRGELAGFVLVCADPTARRPLSELKF
jgi:PAS domain-containing protein